MGKANLAAENARNALEMMQKMNEEGNKSLKQFIISCQREAREREEEMIQRMEKSDMLKIQLMQASQKELNEQQNKLMMVAQEIASRPPPPQPTQTQAANPFAQIVGMATGL